MPGTSTTRTGDLDGVLVPLRRGAAGLVVGDDQLAIGIELQPVDDAAQPQVADAGLEHQFDADGMDLARILELEVSPHQGAGLVEEGGLGFGIEAETDELGVVAELGRGLLEAALGGAKRPLGGRPLEQVLKGQVHQRPARGGRRRWLGQLVDGGEPERQRTVLERRHLRRREGGGRFDDHWATVRRGSDSFGSFRPTPTELWWDPNASGPDEIQRQGKGLYRYTDGGKRYLPGKWPKQPSTALDPAGMVTIFNSPPSGENVKDYASPGS